MPAPHFVELQDLPKCDSNVSFSRVLAAGSVLALVYESRGPNWPDEETYAVVRIDGVSTYLGKGPNDEALHNHPLERFGLLRSALQEIVGSPWIAEIAKIKHKDGIVASWAVKGSRHFLFAFKEDSLDCIADGYALVGVYKSLEEAMDSAFALVRAIR